MTEGEIKFMIGHKLLCSCSKLLRLTADSSGEFLKNRLGDKMQWTDYEDYEFSNAVKLTSGVSVEYVMMFGDGTLEFRRSGEEDCSNWCEFNNEDLATLLIAIEKEIEEIYENENNHD